jgi:DNA (cytosine-5)-methyltransferase 1
MIRYASVCSGIEAPSVAWEPLGWKPVFFSEIEKFPSAALAHHYPDTPNLGNMEEINGHAYNGKVDLLVGGTPCQSFSLAGLRGGLEDARGNLALVFCRLVDQIRPRWVVWENVPGVLSSNGGRDFASIVGALAELGYGCCWRVLDAQYYGVAQRRRRVFLVGHLGDWRPAGAVLFERESLRGNPPPSREAGEEAAGGAGGCASHWGGGPHPSLNQSNSTSGIGLSNQELFSQGGGGLVPDVAYAISCGSGGSKFGSGRHNQDTLIATTVVNARETPIHASNLSLPLGAQDTGHAIFCDTYNGRISGEVANALTAWTGLPAATGPKALIGSAVRRLTPVECERLQGFPDGYTAIPWRGKAPEGCPDGHRYKALGNSMAVPVMRWIGERIQRNA